MPYFVHGRIFKDTLFMFSIKKSNYLKSKARHFCRLSINIFFCFAKDHELIFINFLGNKWNYEKFISYREMLDKIQKEFSILEKLQDHPNDTSKVVYFIVNLV